MFFLKHNFEKTPTEICYEEKNVKFKLYSFIIVWLSSPFLACASDNNDMRLDKFSVELSATRVIYDLKSKGKTITVKNPQDYPMLVQAKMFHEDMKGKSSLMVTPPLMRLDGNQQTQLRIVSNGDEFAKDKETLQWLCVKGIPPEGGDDWLEEKRRKSNGSSFNVQVSINTCLRVIIRPDSLKTPERKSNQNLSWAIEGKELVATNSTPFFVNFAKVNVFGVTINNPGYISPFSKIRYLLPENIKSGDVSWATINDYGGIDKESKFNIKK